ncbi:hypothetical protein [Mycobacterium gastri]|uniref:hypothetical protein n=1 Tax=Mycobacterium gastri TaxID=1777 RepID=UPI0003E5A9F8|nr:hypothetical protein [Mycobacterium gastri]ETW25922.1 hypothetical protein MGAST_30300 [Mycobacterium gastri 'Wayne']
MDLVSGATLADHTASDTSRDPRLTAEVLYRIGTHIGARIQLSTGAQRRTVS